MQSNLSLQPANLSRSGRELKLLHVVRWMIAARNPSGTRLRRDRTPRPPPKSPEQAFQDKEAAADRLTEVIETDEVGRRVRRFYGSPEKCWGPFKHYSRYIIDFDTKK
jgi:hypothetical protein